MGQCPSSPIIYGVHWELRSLVSLSLPGFPFSLSPTSEAENLKSTTCRCTRRKFSPCLRCKLLRSERLISWRMGAKFEHCLKTDLVQPHHDRADSPTRAPQSFRPCNCDPHGYLIFITDGDPGYLKNSLLRSINPVKPIMIGKSWALKLWAGGPVNAALQKECKAAVI